MARRPKIALTGGIACGKSLVATYLNACGVATLDADDVVHELVPADERRRLASVVFADPTVRKQLEARLHPLVKARLEDYLAAGDDLRLAIIPLLFEAHWDKEFDIICCVTAERSVQIERMVTTRGYTRAEAEARLAAQLPVAEKAAQSHYVIENNASAEDLRVRVQAFVAWLRERVKET